MSRYNNTERIGVNETENIVLQKLGWIFREQSIADVGIDAIIEQVIDNNPTGKFIALQIKTGLGNFYKNEKSLVYYSTSVHYEYWISCNIPVLMIAHIPEHKKTYWQLISEDTFRKTDKGWALDIPLKQEFSEKSEKRLSNLVVHGELKDISTEFKTIDDYINDIDDLNQCVTILDNVIVHTRALGKSAGNLTYKLNEYIQKKLPISSPEVNTALAKFRNDILKESTRLKGEIDLFARFFANGFTALRFVTINHYILSGDKKHLEEVLQKLKSFSMTTGEMIENTEEFKATVVSMDEELYKNQEAKKILTRTLDSLMIEARVASNLSEALSNYIEEDLL